MKPEREIIRADVQLERKSLILMNKIWSVASGLNLFWLRSIQKAWDAASNDFHQLGPLRAEVTEKRLQEEFNVRSVFERKGSSDSSCLMFTSRCWTVTSALLLCFYPLYTSFQSRALFFSSFLIISRFETLFMFFYFLLIFVDSARLSEAVLCYLCPSNISTYRLVENPDCFYICVFYQTLQKQVQDGKTTKIKTAATNKHKCHKIKLELEQLNSKWS